MTPRAIALVLLAGIGAKFLSADQTLSPDISGNKLHLKPAGYKIWAEAIIDAVKQLLTAEPQRLGRRCGQFTLRHQPTRHRDALRG